MDTRWRIELLGGLRATCGARIITHFQSQKIATLLAYLAYYGRRSHRREELIELLWPEGEPQAARHSLRQALSFLRQQLEPRPVESSGLSVESPVDGGSTKLSTLNSQLLTVIVADRAAVRLNPDAFVTDVAELDDALKAAAGAKDSQEQAQWLGRAVELYQGELLPGYYDEWVLQERQWLAERYFQALEQLLAHLERASEFERALDYARRGVSADPLREEAHRDLIRLLAAVGQTAAALRQYQELERLLKEQLEATPAAATRALVREIERLAILRSSGVQAFGRSGAQEGSPERLNARTPERLDREGENRLVTLLFADMSRSLETTRDLHPEDGAALVNRLLQAMVDVILKYEGRIDRFQGDGLLAVFGVPHAHEDDPERAIHAAMEIRAAAHHLELEVTAGINTGQVYVGAIGSERHQETTVMGPAVGLGARLQEQAQPGQILVGEVTQQLSRRAFEFAALSLGLKGLPQPVAVYAVEQARGRPEKTRGIEGLRAELIGRDDELAKLKAALAAVPSGQGQIVTLIGEAGVGKSRLVAELKLAALAGVGSWELGVGEAPGASLSLTPNSQLPTPIRWLEGRCLELAMTTSYSLFVDLFRDYFAWRPEEDDRARGERLAACLREFVEQGNLSEEQGEEMGPLLGNLLSLRFGTDWDLRLKNASPEQIRHQTLLAVRDFFAALAHRQPVVLVGEDLHWADGLSLDLLTVLMESLPLAPLFLLCVYRPEREHKCWHLGTIAARKCLERYTELNLRELTLPQSRRLVESLLTIENLPAGVKELILEKSRGNPFFVEEVVRSLIASGMVYRDGPAWRARAEIETINVPESIQSVIASRVDRLRPELQQVLQSAAVIGRLFRPRLLERVVESSELRVESADRSAFAGLSTLNSRLSTALWELEEHDLVYQERVVPEEEYSFKHVLTQETIYQSILRRQRPRLHQQVGEAMEALYPGGLQEHVEQLAYHYERSVADEKAVEYLLKAGDKARRAYLNDAAIGYFQRALDRLERSGLGEGRKKGQLEALEGLAKTYYRAGRRGEEAETLFRQAIAVAREMGAPDRELVRLYFWVGDVLYWRSRYEEMVEIGEQGLALLGEDTESAEAALMNFVVGLGHRCKGNEEKWREFILRNAAFMLRLPYWEECLAVYDQIVHVYADVEKDLAAAMRWVQALKQQAEEHRDLHALGGVYDQTGFLLGNSGDFPGAIAAYQQLLDLCARTGDLALTGWVLGYLLDRYLTLGNLPRVEELVPRLQENNQQFGRIDDRARSSLAIGTLRLCQGRPDEAVAAVQEAAHLWREMDPSRKAWAAQALGRVYLAQGRRPEAWAQFEAAIVLTGQATAERLRDLEAAADHPDSLDRFCRRFRAEHPEAGASSPVQWYLEPAEANFGFWIWDFGLPASENEVEGPNARAPENEIQNPKSKIQNGRWVWQDPFGDGSFTVQNGLEIHAANGRDLWHLNLSAPRLLRSVAGAFAIQAVCLPLTPDQPAMGGILLWKDKQNYLRLDRGTRGPHEVSFQGCLGNKDVIIGRGRLPAERIFLRLERQGSRVNALCSADGQNWFTVGHTEFPVADPLEVGLHAIGNIDRTLYPGAYPEGTAIRFETFDLWTNGER